MTEDLQAELDRLRSERDKVLSAIREGGYGVNPGESLLYVIRRLMTIAWPPNAATHWFGQWQEARADVRRLRAAIEQHRDFWLDFEGKHPDLTLSTAAFDPAGDANERLWEALDTVPSVER